MSTASAEAGSKKSGWLKAILGTFAGLFSGAVMMYLSPLLDKVVKPSKPVANFSIDLQDLTVTFSNKSTGGSQGWWDFGDGSPLEPVIAGQDIVSHTYANPGSYTAKLTLRNFLGDESERTVNVQLDHQHLAKPEIQALDVTPVTPGSFAPATFRVMARTRNANLYIWSLSDDRPLEISEVMGDSQERMVTFYKPGGYMVRLAAVSCGKNAVERSDIIYVNEPPQGTIAALLNVADQATQVEAVLTPQRIEVSFPNDHKESIYRFERQIPAKYGFEIVEARLPTLADAAARNVRVQIAPDRRSAQVSGELVHDASRLKKNQPAPHFTVQVQMKQERRSPVARAPETVAGLLNVPGSTLLPLPTLPAGWVAAQRQVRLELRDGDRILWQESQLPRNAAVTIQGKRCVLNAVQLKDQVKLDLVEIKSGQSVATN